MYPGHMLLQRREQHQQAAEHLGQQIVHIAGRHRPRQLHAAEALLRKAGQSFYNISPLDMATLMGQIEFTELSGLRAGLAAKSVQAAAGEPVERGGSGLEVTVSQAIYRGDAAVRRAKALQAHPLTVGARVVLNAADAAATGLAEGAMAKLGNGVGTATLQVVVDDRVAPGCAWIESGYGATAPLAASATLEVAHA